MSQESKFKKGDMVCHKTNKNQKMMVLSVEENLDAGGQVKCSWVPDSLYPQSYTFYDFELEKLG